MDEAKYWRVYYKIQELLSKEFIECYEEKSSDGIRKLSTLPLELNLDAMDISHFIMRVTDGN